LPPELAASIEDRPYACVTAPTDRGTVFVLKAPRHEIASVGGQVPMQLRHELYSHARAPVVRMLLTIYDQPYTPLAFESFINVRDSDQLEAYADLARQRAFRLLFYDERLRHRLSKRLPNHAGEQMEAILGLAARLSVGIPHDWYDFDLAKARVQREVPL
jgi:hypothetical protein